jgi:hypothetical protein
MPATLSKPEREQTPVREPGSHRDHTSSLRINRAFFSEEVEFLGELKPGVECLQRWVDLNA